MFATSYGFRVSILDKSGGPGMFPRIIVVLLVVVVIVRIVQIIRRRELNNSFAFLEMFQGKRLVYMVFTLVYMVLLPFVGYLLSTVAYLLVTIFYFYRTEFDDGMTRRQTVMVTVTNIVLATAVYLFFTRWMNILLPEGILGV